MYLILCFLQILFQKTKITLTSSHGLPSLIWHIPPPFLLFPTVQRQSILEGMKLMSSISAAGGGWTIRAKKQRGNIKEGFQTIC